MKLIGLTGGIGSGKSFVADIIRKHFDFYIINTDAVARSQTDPGGVSYQAVVREFGDGILDGADFDGKEMDMRPINRAALAELVFHDAVLLKRLNALTHPPVQDYIMDKKAQLLKEGRYQAIVIEAALLIEAGYVPILDALWYVYAPAPERRRRLLHQRGYSNDKLDAIFRTQMPEREFFSHSTFVIQNGNGMSEEKLVLQLHDAVASLT